MTLAVAARFFAPGLLADALASNLRAQGQMAIRTTVDDFQRPRVDRYRRGEYSPEGYYRDSFDYATLQRSLLDPLGPEGDRMFRTATFDYLRDTERVGVVRVAAPDAVLTVDGLFLLRAELANAWDFSIFVSVTSDETLRRALVRDAALFGSPDEVERRY